MVRSSACLICASCSANMGSTSPTVSGDGALRRSSPGWPSPHDRRPSSSACGRFTGKRARLCHLPSPPGCKQDSPVQRESRAHLGRAWRAGSAVLART
jgi:hypothetical protein